MIWSKHLFCVWANYHTSFSDQFPTPLFYDFSTWKYLQEFFQCEVFCQTSSSFSSQLFFSFILLNYLTVGSPDLISRSSHTKVVWTLPLSAIFLSHLTAHPALSLFMYLLCFYLLYNSLFQSFIFIKWHINLPPGDKEAKLLHSLLSVHFLNNCCTVTILRWLSLVMCVCYLHGDFWTEALSAKFVLHAIAVGML